MLDARANLEAFLGQDVEAEAMLSSPLFHIFSLSSLVGWRPSLLG